MRSSASFLPFLPSLSCLVGLCALASGCGSDATSSPGSAGAPAASGGIGGASAAGGLPNSASGGSPEAAAGAGASGGLSSAGSGADVGLPPSTAGAGGSGGSAAGAAGAGGSSGIAGSAGSAGAGGATAPPSGCNGALLCDDFESFASSAQPNGQWKTTTTGGGSIVVDTTHAYSGSKAAHFHGTVGKDAAYMIAQGSPLFPVSGDTFFVRFMMYIERWSIGNPMHNRLVWVGSSAALRNADGTGYAMETFNGIGVERIASGHYRTTAQHLTDSTNMGKWLCWEMEIDNKGGPVPTGSGTARPHLFREGVDLTMAIAGQTTGWNAVPFDLLQFSLFAYQTDTAPADYWIDDIVMNNKRIGCPAASP